jgi:hypothetical protein
MYIVQGWQFQLIISTQFADGTRFEGSNYKEQILQSTTIKKNLKVIRDDLMASQFASWRPKKQPTVLGVLTSN